jgi:small basic protein
MRRATSTDASYAAVSLGGICASCPRYFSDNRFVLSLVVQVLITVALAFLIMTVGRCSPVNYLATAMR